MASWNARRSSADACTSPFERLLTRLERSLSRALIAPQPTHPLQECKASSLSPALRSMADASLKNSLGKLIAEGWTVSLEVDMVELIVSVLRTNHRSMSREAESVILLQAAVQPNALLEAGQAETAVRCMHTILAAGENIPSLATSGLLGCFDLDRLVPVLRAHDSSRNNSSEEARAPLAYLPEICCNAGPTLAVTLLTLALEALMLPGGALCGRQLLSWLVPPDDASFLAAGMAVALSLRNPEARKAALEPMLQPNASTVWLCAALDVITQRAFLYPLSLAERSFTSALHEPTLPYVAQASANVNIINMIATYNVHLSSSLEKEQALYVQPQP